MKRPLPRTLSYWKPLQAPSKNPSKKHLHLKNLLRTPLRSALLHDSLGVHPRLRIVNKLVCALCCKNLFWAFCFCTAADPSRCPRAHEANASSEAQSRASRRSWKSVHKQHPRPENQDSQHKRNQPRGSFPESQFLIIVYAPSGSWDMQQHASQKGS